ncbi:MAG: hypothetical protein JOZ19_10540 [Rubrobacter sp.]|nr:hypothetical protein [Rubrobacter sp.]
MQKNEEHVPEDWTGKWVTVEYRAPSAREAPYAVIETHGTLTNKTPLGVVLEGNQIIAYDAITSIFLSPKPPERPTP